MVINSASMTRGLRIFVAVALSVMLVFTSHSMAVARGMPGPDGQMVICTGQGPVMVSVDATGNPVGPPHICPDATLSLLNTALVTAAHTAPAPQAYQKVRFTEVGLNNGTRSATPQARGPPLTA
ncbi:hypothetical protein [Roseovarius sp. 2305UL8-3]|uniref:hypothetical protein n=1 Tax=Roseovarius conchicola TaxID=3121636 RepID=UPI0035277AC4